MPLRPDDPAARLQALEVGVVALLHQLSRDLARVARTGGSPESILLAEWTATDIAALVLLRCELQAATGDDGRV